MLSSRSIKILSGSRDKINKKELELQKTYYNKSILSEFKDFDRDIGNILGIPVGIEEPTDIVKDFLDNIGNIDIEGRTDEEFTQLKQSIISFLLNVKSAYWKPLKEKFEKEEKEFTEAEMDDILEEIINHEGFTPYIQNDWNIKLQIQNAVNKFLINLIKEYSYEKDKYSANEIKNKVKNIIKKLPVKDIEIINKYYQAVSKTVETLINLRAKTNKEILTELNSREELTFFGFCENIIEQFELLFKGRKDNKLYPESRHKIESNPLSESSITYEKENKNIQSIYDSMFNLYEELKSNYPEFNIFKLLKFFIDQFQRFDDILFYNWINFEDWQEEDVEELKIPLDIDGDIGGKYYLKQEVRLTVDTSNLSPSAVIENNKIKWDTNDNFSEFDYGETQTHIYESYGTKNITVKTKLKGVNKEIESKVMINIVNIENEIKLSTEPYMKIACLPFILNINTSKYNGVVKYLEWRRNEYEDWKEYNKNSKIVINNCGERIIYVKMITNNDVEYVVSEDYMVEELELDFNVDAVGGEGFVDKITIKPFDIIEMPFYLDKVTLRLIHNSDEGWDEVWYQRGMPAYTNIEGFEDNYEIDFSSEQITNIDLTTNEYEGGYFGYDAFKFQLIKSDGKIILERKKTMYNKEMGRDVEDDGYDSDTGCWL